MNKPEINRNLFLVLACETPTGGKAYIHAAPISREVYKEHFMIIGQTYSRMFSEGLSFAAGPRTAYHLLEHVARERKVWEGENGVQNTLVNEIVRLANYVYPEDGKGWQTLPLDVAVARGLVELEEAIDELVFFTCVSCVNKRAQVSRIMIMVSGLWGSSISSSGLTAWIASLPTLKTAETTGETVPELSPTSSPTPPGKDSVNSSDIAV